MKVDNPLSREFMANFPAEAARTLEQVSIEHVAALLIELPASQVMPVMVSMLPQKAAACLEKMPSATAARFLTELPVATAARLYRLLTQKKDEVSNLLTESSRRKIRRYLVYSSGSAGALINSSFDTLPDTIAVADALRRIERLEHAPQCEIYITDELHHLVGSIQIGRLLIADSRVMLRDIMNRKTLPVSVHMLDKSLPSHPGWQTRYRLPVVERDNTLVGVLEYNQIRHLIHDTKASASRDPLENVLSIASLYWLSMAQLLDSILGMTGPGKGER